MNRASKSFFATEPAGSSLSNTPNQKRCTTYPKSLKSFLLQGRKPLLGAFVLLSSLTVNAQTIIDNPKIGFSTASYVKPVKIELTDTTTVISFHTRFSPGNWILIPTQTYIQQDGAGERLYAKRTEGIPFNQQYNMPNSGEVFYKVVFPSLAKATKKIDYGEGNDGGSWFIYDIQIKPSAFVSKVPELVAGNWFNAVNGSWELSFLDTVAIYKQQVWAYETIKFKDGKGSIKLKSQGKTIELLITVDKLGSCSIGEKAGNPVKYVADQPKQTVKTPNDAPYALPVFKADSATYCGFVKGFSPRVGIKTFTVHVDDIISGKQSSFLGTISADGFFYVKVPLLYPHMVWVRSSLYNGSVFLEPGKTLFQMFDADSRSDNQLYMGEMAAINTDLQKLEKVRSFNYYQMTGKILLMKPADYKQYCQDLQKKDLRAIDSIYKTNTIGAKAYQVKKLDIDYQYFCNIMEYTWNFESAYREKYKIPRTQRELPVKIDTLKVDYYDFVTNNNANNPLAILCSSYDSYINRLKYLEILGSRNLSISTDGIAEELEKMGYNFTEPEKKLVARLKEESARSNSPEQKAFNEKYGKQAQEFYKKYNDTLKSFYKTAKPADISQMEKFLTDKGVKLSADEKQLINAMVEQNKLYSAKSASSDFPGYNDSINAFHTRHREAINNYFTRKRREARTEGLEKQLGVKKGFVTDIMEAQDVCRGIVEELTPVSEVALKSAQQGITTPFIADYMALCNKQAFLKIEANKLKKGYVVNETPKTEADKLFDGIMQKYKGKVVYVDFWATWCGPCRSGIEDIKPLKEEMEGKNVVFVYITGPSSPKNTYDNMIPDIKGEHYRVSQDEWNYLCSKFNISGIPHYVLVGKNGEVINPKLGHMDNNSLKSLLERKMKE